MKSGSNIFNDGPLLIKKIMYEYKFSKNKTTGRVHGIPTNGLSPAYFNKITEKKNEINKLIVAMSKQFQCNFELELNFLANGEVDFNRISFKLVKTFKRNYDNGSPMPMKVTVLAFEQIIALCPYMSEVEFFSFNHELCYFTAEVTCTYDELLNVFEHPFANDTIIDQWAYEMRCLESTYSRTHYSYSGTMPIIDGELSRADLEICVASTDVLGGLK